MKNQNHNSHFVDIIFIIHLLKKKIYLNVQEFIVYNFIFYLNNSVKKYYYLRKCSIFMQNVITYEENCANFKIIMENKRPNFSKLF